jgi:hypothetical protein
MGNIGVDGLVCQLVNAISLSEEEKLHECLANAFLIVPIDDSAKVEPSGKYLEGKRKFVGESRSDVMPFFEMLLQLF